MTPWHHPEGIEHRAGLNPTLGGGHDRTGVKPIHALGVARDLATIDD